MVTLQVTQRWMNFAIANPARQVFFTVVGREEKYKAKNLIDVVIYRGSDALYGWVYDSLQALGLKLGAIAVCALPVVVGWVIISTALGRMQERLTTTRHDEGPSEMIHITRRHFAALAGGLLAFAKTYCSNRHTLLTRAIPSSNERIPAVGLGTAYVFDHDDETTRSKADAVVKRC